MKITKSMLGLLIGLAGCLTLGAFADGPAIKDVAVRQRWPWSRLVDINYVLVCDPAVKVDVTLTAKNGTDQLALPLESLSGDNLCGASQGARHVVWDPVKAGYANEMLEQFNVQLTPAAIPLYMIVDLTLATNDADQITYVYEDEVTNGLWGAWVRNPVTNAGAVVESVIWTGVTTNDIYKTDKLVLRRIPAGVSAGIGMAKDMYVGVFEVTQGQWSNIMGSASAAYFTNATGRMSRPMEQVSYNTMRGAPGNGIDWPASGTAVYSESFIGKLRRRTGLEALDLPFFDQWTYACQAGTTTWFNDGEAAANVSGTNGSGTNVWLDVLGRYKYNGGCPYEDVPYPYVERDCTPEHGTAVVGSYRPNAWGLYDMHGNVFEFCLEWHTVNIDRKKRSGNWDSIATNCRSAAYSAESPSGRVERNGFRLFYVLP
ncbi:MAG: formylglycine-generating enzyme family protein [Kiritimatiellae bacterium]|nr:formylglycine-generating enzyme family protein [Kiritimatiellia bacterium]